MTPGDENHMLRSAMIAVRDCAETMDRCAVSLLEALPAIPIDEALRVSALEQSAGLKDAASRAMFELAMLQTGIGEATADAKGAVPRLAAIESTLMATVVAMTAVLERLETAAEGDVRQERAFVLVIEALGAILQSFKTAKAATQALRAALAH